MSKNLLFISFSLLIVISIIYPSKKENTKLFDYCYSLEKVLSRNSIQNRKNASQQVRSISKDILKFGVSKTRGALINKIIYQYKNSNNSKIIKLVPNKFYCYAGYWIENINPGTFESIIYSKSKKTINEFKDLKDEVDDILNGINSEYKVIKKEFNSLF
tara:strand:+ start:825 stop:1301 length:477 start_codon:yes stop_codon:yes gene_type:complete